MKRAKNQKWQKYTLSQKIVFGAIGASFVLVILMVVFGIFYRPETRITSLIDRLAREYYETHLYASFSGLAEFKDDPEKMMELYRENGFSAVSLRQILLYDNQKNNKYANELTKYCDENNTFVKFYPIAPYGAKDYRAEYTYTCEF